MNPSQSAQPVSADDRDAAADPELQASLARHGLACFDTLLAHVPPATPLPSEQIGAIVRLISQAADVGRRAEA